MKEGTSDHQQIAGPGGEVPVLDLKPHLTVENVENLKIAVALHADVATPAKHKETHIDRGHLVEWPQVNSSGIDLRFDGGVTLFPNHTVCLPLAIGFNPRLTRR